ncbi:hypothetical protein GCM10027289_04180 [Tsukamurella serpentis]
MNLRWFALGALVVVPLAGCSSASDETASGPVSFSPVAVGAVPPSAPATGAEVPRAAAGTVCGSVSAASGGAAVVIREGRANCAEALRVARAYSAAAVNADGQAVTVETSGWRCSARLTDSAALCRSEAAAFSVG